MKRLAAAAAALLATGLAHAVEYNQVQLDKSQVGFNFKQMNVPVDGRFRKFSAQVSFDPAKPEAGSAKLEVDLNSIDAGGDDANVEAKGKPWFNTAQFPTARFVSTAVKPLGGNRYEVAGKLTIKNTTRDVITPATFTGQGNAGQFDGTLQIKRADYKVGEGVWADFDTVANEVQIKFRIAVAAATVKK